MRGSRARRLTFPVVVHVAKRTRQPVTWTPTGVLTARPSRRKVVSSATLDLRSGAKSMRGTPAATSLLVIAPTRFLLGPAA
jgi:hypothetical protein